MDNVFLNYTVAAGSADMDKTFRVINLMVDDGIIESYAVGGATAAFFYIEPDTTFDVDIFFVVSGVEEKALNLLAPVYDYLQAKGHPPHEDAIMIEGFRVQFLPVFNPLNDEAVQNANNLTYRDVPVRVMSPEYLIAIMLQTGRYKDYARVARFLEAGAFDSELLNQILRQHKLDSKWKTLRRLGRNLNANEEIP